MGTSIETQAEQTPLVARGVQLWPVRYKPLPDELLSCWLVRLAHGHGMKVQTFCNAIFGERLQVWNRDIDRLAPSWLLSELSVRTGTPLQLVLGTTLRAYEGLLYRRFRSAGVLNWILFLQMYHRKRNGFGLQFCPACLAKDVTPYFRKRWRIALNTVCLIHSTMLLDRCPTCRAAIAVHRLDMNETEMPTGSELAYCHFCGFDLRHAPSVEASPYDQCTAGVLRDACASVEPHDIDGRWNLDAYSVMRQLCRIMTARYAHARLRAFVLENLNSKDIALTEGHISFEMRPIEERHHLLLLTAWLLVDLEPRLTAAWRAGAVRYNLLLKDFSEPPPFYKDIVEKMSNWRDRL